MQTHQPRIETAIDALDHELNCATVERDAFAQFRSRVTAIEPTPATPSQSAVTPGGDVAVLAGTGSEPDPAARAVRRAYRETVLSMPHFEAEYDESISQNAAAELGTGLATRLFDDGHLTPRVHDTLLAACDQAIEERETYRETLQTERASLCHARDRLDEIESRAVELGLAIDETTDSRECGAIDRELRALESDCETLAKRRQKLLHGRSTARLVGITAESLVRFLYAECDATCPALADVADCLDTIRTHRERSLE